MGSGNFRGSSPTPVIPGYYAADGNTFVPTSPSAPLPVSSAAAPAAALPTTDNAINGTLAALGSVAFTATAASGVGHRVSLIFTNTGATNSIYFKAAATSDATGFELKPGAGFKWTDQDGTAQKARAFYSTGGSTYSYEEVLA